MTIPYTLDIYKSSIGHPIWMVQAKKHKTCALQARECAAAGGKKVQIPCSGTITTRVGRDRTWNLKTRWGCRGFHRLPVWSVFITLPGCNSRCLQVPLYSISPRSLLVARRWRPSLLGWRPFLLGSFCYERSLCPLFRPSRRNPRRAPAAAAGPPATRASGAVAAASGSP